MSGNEGLPTTVLKKDAVVINKKHRCITILRVSAGTIGAGVGAFLGMLGGGIAGSSLIYFMCRSFHDKNCPERVGLRVGLGFPVATMVVGTGFGATVGKKVAVYAVNAIFGRE